MIAVQWKLPRDDREDGFGWVDEALTMERDSDEDTAELTAELLADCEAVSLAAEGIAGSSGVAGLLNPGVGSKGTQPKLLK